MDINSKLLVLQFRTDDSLDHERLCMFRHMDLEPVEIDFLRIFGGTETMEDSIEFIKNDTRPLIIAGSGQYYLAKDNDTQEMQQQVNELKQKFYPLLRYLFDVRDRPILGICFGHQMLSDCFGGLAYDKQQAETGIFDIQLNEHGKDSPLFEGISDVFKCVLGHHDSTISVPAGAIVLASSARCRVQALDYGDSIYSVQFHPELDMLGLEERLKLYAHYADNSSDDSLKKTEINESPKILNNFLRIAGLL